MSRGVRRYPSCVGVVRNGGEIVKKTSRGGG
jgi:hypothetical protein